MTLNETAPAPRASVTIKDDHWYGHHEGLWYPLYGAGKSFGLREARLYLAEGKVAAASTTTVIDCARKFQVERWGKEQTAKAAYGLNAFSLTEQQFIDIAVERASHASNPAAELGKKIHAAIELAVGGKDYDAAMDTYVKALLYHRGEYSLISIAQEKCVGSLGYGYAGTADDLCEGMVVCDYKSRGKAEVYPTDWMQVASYGFAEWGPDYWVKGAGIVFPISTKEPGIVKPEMLTGQELLKYFKAFLGLVQYWRVTNNYVPYGATV